MGEVLKYLRRDHSGRVGWAVAAAAVILLLVVAWVAWGALHVTIPDLNSNTHADTGGDGGTVTSGMYADIKARVTVTGSESCFAGACKGSFNIATGGFLLSVHEVLAPSPGPTTIGTSLLSFGEDCHVKAAVYYTTPDDSGRGDSAELDLHLDQPVILSFGKLNMFTKGLLTLSFDVYLKGCKSASGYVSAYYGDWTKIGSMNSISFPFDGVDNYTF